MKYILILTSLFSLFVLFACTNEQSQSLESFYESVGIENIDKIILVDGATGFSKTVTNQEKIDEFLSLTNDIVLTPQNNQEKRDGTLYTVIFFDGHKEFSFTPNKIAGTYYNSNPDIYPIVEAYYNNLTSKKK